ALAPDPRAPGYFYLLTDRGPNTDSNDPDKKVFPLPRFTPQIGRFKLQGDRLVLVKIIEIKNAKGKKITGLPNPQHGNTGETAVDTQGRELGTDPDGLDSEGLVALKDGGFWISDEYGPWLVHLNPQGRIIERIGPFPGAKSLPKVLALRRPNRGMEGLAITPDGKTLVGLMQNPVDNPDAGVRKTSRLNRLVLFDPRTGASKQYAYMLDATSAVVSEIAAITDHTFVASERDQLFQGDPKKPSKLKRIYKIDIAQATEIGDPADSPNGKTINGKTLEQLNESELIEAGIVPVTKEMVVDLLALPGGYPHDKAEGLAVISDTMIAVSNDDDFGIVPDGKGGIAAKRLPGANDMIDINRVYFIRLDKPLR
ncbi:MAG: esterase-like activity of phytase family protein, partial [Burkholderiales bacterium]